MHELNLPKAAFVGKVIPKNKLAQKAILNPKAKQSLTADVAKIRWTHKLSTDTIHLPECGDTKEIHIFTVEVKIKKSPDLVLKNIAKIIPYRLLFKLEHGGEYMWALPHRHDGAYTLHKKSWGAPLGEVFHGADMHQMYENIFKDFISISADQNTTLEDAAALEQKAVRLRREIDGLKRKIKNSKQLKDKMEYRRELLGKKEELREM